MDTRQPIPESGLMEVQSTEIVWVSGLAHFLLLLDRFGTDIIMYLTGLYINALILRWGTH